MLAEGLGLKIMRARAELIGAVLRVGARSPAGTRVECLCDGRGAGAARDR
jgi:nitrate/nitrite-specific signal transduction histidine kinase